MKPTIALIVVSLLAPLSSLQAAEHLIHPGDSPQAILDRAAPGDRLVFLPGLHQHVKNINACVLIHGRVRKVLIEDITMTDTMRSVMAYGEHTGKFLPGGKVGPGDRGSRRTLR